MGISLMTFGLAVDNKYTEKRTKQNESESRKEFSISLGCLEQPNNDPKPIKYILGIRRSRKFKRIANKHFLM